jgi:hypothetical protein
MLKIINPQVDDIHCFTEVISSNEKNVIYLFFIFYFGLYVHQLKEF